MQLETVAAMMIVIIRIVVMMVEIVADLTLTKDLAGIVNAKMVNKIILWNVMNVSARCLKIIEKVSFNIATEARYVYIVSGQKFVQNTKKVNLATF